MDQMGFRRLAMAYGGRRMFLRSLFWPKGFNEKVQRRKLFNRDRRMPFLQDKVAVKEFVRTRIGSDWIIPTLWHGRELPPIADRNWPLPFVLKASHGSTWNIFVREPINLDWPEIELIGSKWLRTVYGAEWGEWLYSLIPPQLLVEPFMGEPPTLPIDYKFWLFHGCVAFIQVDTDREFNHKRAMFDVNWNRLPFTVGYPLEERPLQRPNTLDRMIEAARILARDWDFVRVDFFEIDRRPLFGEMTFYPGSGFETFDPPQWNERVGRLWR
jgi:hypothetical protein